MAIIEDRPSRSRPRRRYAGGAPRAALLGLVLAAAARSAAAESRPALRSELPEPLLAQLAAAEDYGFAFDFPGYYALLSHVRAARHSPGHTQSPLAIDDWTALAERPRDLRGMAVTIDGVVGRNKSYRHVRHPEIGTVWQLELTGTQPQPIACTVICTDNCDDIPLGAELRVTAYFVMMRQYHAQLGDAPRAAALLVGTGPTAIATRAPRPAGAARGDWRWLLAPLAAGLVLTWILLRRGARGPRRDYRALTATHAAPQSLAGELAEWADGEARTVQTRETQSRE